jgi:hypothetical protein
MTWKWWKLYDESHLAAAKAKGWKPQYFDGKEWKVYAGSESR